MFFGRESELENLAALFEKGTASLVTCRGRRRIGKSALVEQFAKLHADNFLRFEGLPPRPGMTDARQRSAFCAEIAAQSKLPKLGLVSWPEAFALLDSIIPQKGRTVVLLDEISWMGGYDPDFAGYLKAAWDRLFSRHGRLVLVLCGSVSAWIVDNILKNTGFAGRNSLDMEVTELPLSVCDSFFGKRSDRISAADKLDILSVTGAVPRYLQEIRPSLSPSENIRRLCFVPGGLLFREFDEIFADIFGKKSERRKAVLKALAEGRASATELASRLGGQANGHLAETLDELRLSGFVAKDCGLNPETGMPVRETRYRIKDNYARFYLRYVEPRKQAIEAGLFTFGTLDRLDGWSAILGLQFENLVLNHLPSLLPKIGVGDSLVLSAAPFVQGRTRHGAGCQIDLLVQTKRAECVVEIKRRREIGSEVIEDVARKIERLRIPRGKTVRTALVYDGNLAPSIREDGFFDFIVPAAELF